MKVVRLSALRTGRLYPPGNIPGKSTLRPGRIMSMKNSNDTIGNRTPDLPVCNAVPQLRHRVPLRIRRGKKEIKKERCVLMAKPSLCSSIRSLVGPSAVGSAQSVQSVRYGLQDPELGFDSQNVQDSPLFP